MANQVSKQQWLPEKNAWKGTLGNCSSISHCRESKYPSINKELFCCGSEIVSVVFQQQTTSNILSAGGHVSRWNMLSSPQHYNKLHICFCTSEKDMNENDYDTRIKIKNWKLLIVQKAKDKELEWMKSTMEISNLLTVMEESLMLLQFWLTKIQHPTIVGSTSSTIWTKSGERGSKITHWRKHAKLLVWRGGLQLFLLLSGFIIAQPSHENL